MPDQIMLLKREISTDNSTIGSLFMPDGSWECYTLEDVIRDHKIPKETAIPQGIYEIIINWSNRFQRPMPLLLDVPFFRGIRFHRGNTKENTEGCILVGDKKISDAIYESIPAFQKLYPKIEELLRNGKLFVRIEGGIPAYKWKECGGTT